MGWIWLLSHSLLTPHCMSECKSSANIPISSSDTVRGKELRLEAPWALVHSWVAARPGYRFTRKFKGPVKGENTDGLSGAPRLPHPSPPPHPTTLPGSPFPETTCANCYGMHPRFCRGRQASSNEYARMQSYVRKASDLKDLKCQQISPTVALPSGCPATPEHCHVPRWPIPYCDSADV